MDRGQQRRQHPLASSEVRVAQSQERRRQEALERQRSARRNLTERARLLATTTNGGEEMETTETSEETPLQKKKRQREAIARRAAARWWREFCVPEWLVDVPERLADWYCVPRPEGRRCVLVASAGRTTSRTPSGDVIHAAFESCLPSRQGPCVLEAFFDGATYHCVDCLSWAGHSLYDCTAEFRFFWLRTKLGEVSTQATTSPAHVPLRCVPFFDCDANGLRRAAAEAPLPFQRDGLLLYDKRGYYALGSTPLVLLFKDSSVSRYFDVPLPPRPFPFSLRVGEDGRSLEALDGVPVPVVVLNKEDDAAQLLEPGDLARVELCEQQNETLVARFVSRCSPKRPAPDSITKLLVTLRHRRGHALTLHHLLDRAAPAVAVSPVPHGLGRGAAGSDDDVPSFASSSSLQQQQGGELLPASSASFFFGGGGGGGGGSLSTVPVVVAMDESRSGAPPPSSSMLFSSSAAGSSSVAQHPQQIVS